MVSEVGAVIVGRYVLRERIGSGSMGEVWRADDTKSDRQVAVKVLGAGLAADTFAATSRAVMALRDSTIVEVYGWSQANGQDYLIMEYVAGTDLATLLARQGRLAPAHAMSIVAEAASALQAVHTAGMVHGDVRPGHILLRPDGRLVLIDVGLAAARRAATDLAATDPAATDPAATDLAATDLAATDPAAAEPPAWSAYLAPEQLPRAPATVATDVYALGVVAYECLTGRRPPQPQAAAGTTTGYEPPALPDGIPDAVRTVVARAMAGDPAARWRSGAELARAAMAAASSTGVSSTVATGIAASGATASPVSVAVPEPGPAAAPAHPTGSSVAAGWAAPLTRQDAFTATDSPTDTIAGLTGRGRVIALAAVSAAAVAVLLVGAFLSWNLGGPDSAAAQGAPTGAGPASAVAGSGVSHVIGPAAAGSTGPGPVTTTATTTVVSSAAPPALDANPTTAAPGPLPAPAPAGPDVITVQVGAQVIHCAAPSLATGYGPIHTCTEVSGGQGRNGLYSPLTGQFNPTPDWLPVGEAVVYKLSVSANDGQVGTFVGFASLQTGYGPVVYGTQYQGSQGRFGNYNLLANAFFPSGDWATVVT